MDGRLDESFENQQISRRATTQIANIKFDVIVGQFIVLIPRNF
jgi:hypothetical protein